MPYRLRTCRSVEELGAALHPIGHYFGWRPVGEEVERFARMLPPERMHAVWDGADVVAGAGVFPFELAVPGASLPCAGVTVVGVFPEHRRRGLNARMMNAQLADVRERGEPLAALWASEETIYGRYGYGQASHTLTMRLPHGHGAFRPEAPSPVGRVRRIDGEEALALLPRVYDRVRRGSPGFLSRSKAWWELRQLDDHPDRRPRGAGPLERVVLEADGRRVGYALYRLLQEQVQGTWQRALVVREAVGSSPAATAQIWRFLLSVDWVDEIRVRWMPLDHPLTRLVARVSRMGLEVDDGFWIRLVDVDAALRARSYEPGRATVEVVADPQFPDNLGTWTVGDGVARRSRRRPDVRVDVQGLASAYLGGFGFAELAAAGLAQEASRGGLARADGVFRTPAQPWCPEVF